MSYLPRQAVIIFHGIGEQVPLATLRRFVDNVARGAHFVSAAPDRITRRSYARRYDVRWNQDASGAELKQRFPQIEVEDNVQAQTDFYEFYWAFRFRDTTWGDLRAWMKRLLMRPLWTLSTTRLVGRRRLGWLPFLLWLAGFVLLLGTAIREGSWGDFWSARTSLIVGGALLLAAVIVADLTGAIALALAVGGLLGASAVVAVVLTALAAPGGWGALAAVVGAIGVATTVLPFASGVAAGFALRHLGDAARYLNPNPRNILEIDAIRSDAVELLRRLHELGDPFDGSYYERIIVVGHSLGSVIAFDALRQYWTYVNRQLRFADTPGEENWVQQERLEAVKGLEQESNTLLSAYFRTGGAEGIDAELSEPRAAFWKAQRSLFQTLNAPAPGDVRDTLDDRPVLPRWLVSDFVTLGSPLAHAELLMASNQGEMLALQSDRTWPTCPPQPQRVSKWRPLRFRLAGPPDQVVTALHQAALFAATRWTNVYFDRDLVGGPIGPVFGAGVKDVKVAQSTGSVILDSCSRTHSKYWRESSKHDALGELDALIGRRVRAMLALVAPPAPARRQQIVKAVRNDHHGFGEAVELEVRYVLAPTPDEGAPDLGLGKYRRLWLEGVETCDIDALPGVVDAIGSPSDAWELKLVVSPDILQPSDQAEEIGA